MRFLLALSLLLSFAPQTLANEIISLRNSPVDIGVAGGQLYVREGNELFKYDGLGLQKIGVVAANPFEFISFRNALVTREGNELHKYHGGQWVKIGSVASEPFQWLNTPIGLLTREGNELHCYNGSGWDKIGNAYSPFSWQFKGNRLYTREGSEIHLFQNGDWRKVGKVAAEPFSFAVLEDGLLTIEGDELHQYNERNDQWQMRSRVSNAELFTAGQDAFFRRGKELLRLESGSWNHVGYLESDSKLKLLSTRSSRWVLQDRVLSRVDYRSQMRFVTRISAAAKVVQGKDQIFILEGMKIYSYR